MLLAGSSCQLSADSASRLDCTGGSGAPSATMWHSAPAADQTSTRVRVVHTTRAPSTCGTCAMESGGYAESRAS